MMALSFQTYKYVDKYGGAEGYFTVLDPEAELQEWESTEGGEGGSRASREDVSATIMGGGGEGSKVYLEKMKI